MSIAVLCSCGKAMRAPAEWAGRDAKCPGCGQMVHIPGNGAIPKPAPTNKPAVVACTDCGKPLLVPPGMAGKLVACPACGGHVRLPGAKTAAGVSARPPAAKMSAPPKRKSELRRQAAPVATFEPEDDADDDLDESPRPKKKRGKTSKSNSKLILWACLGGGGLVAIVLVVTLILMFLPGGGGGSLVAMVPADTEVFAVVHVGDFLRTPSGQKVRKMALDAAKDAKLGKQLDSVKDIVVFSRAGSTVPIGLVATNSAINVAEEEKDFADSHTKGTLNGKTFFAPKNAGQPGFLVYDARTKIVGTEADITDYLKQPPAAAGPMAPTLRAAASDGNMLFVAFQGSALRKAGPIPPGMAPDFQMARITLTDGTAMRGNIALEFPDAAKATTAKEQLDTMLGMAQMAAKKQMNGMPMPGMGELVEKALAKAKPSLSGNVVNVPLEVESSIGDLAEKIQPMVGMLMMMGGGGPGFGPGPGMGPGMGPGPGFGPGQGMPQPKMPGKKKVR